MSLPPWLADAWQGAVRRAGRTTPAPRPADRGAAAASASARWPTRWLRAALCTQRGADGRACGACRGCQLRAAGSHPDLVRVTLGLRDDGKLRTEIIIDQIRALSQRLSMSSQFGGAQLALVDPADRMNASAANALLKTLEEPASATVIVLVADDPARLPATIRSRCQRVDVRAADPRRSAGLAARAAGRCGHRERRARCQPRQSRPGAAMDRATARWRSAAPARTIWPRCSEGRRSASEIADRWAADRPDARLWFAAALARDEARRLARGEAGAFGLTTRGEIPKLAAWYGRANRARDLLATPLRSDLIVLDLMLAWPFHAAIPRRA